MNLKIAILTDKKEKDVIELIKNNFKGLISEDVQFLDDTYSEKLKGRIVIKDKVSDVPDVLFHFNTKEMPLPNLLHLILKKYVSY